MTPRAIADVIARLSRPDVACLPAPAYRGVEYDFRPRVGLAVESMKRHTSDEGFQLFEALATAGYTLHGHAIGDGLTDVREILEREDPATVVLQDKREYEGLTIGRRQNPAVPFRHALALRDCGAFVGTVLKDAHQRPEYHRGSAQEIGCHFWVTYYATPIVCHLAPFMRPQHVVRTWHTIDPALVPPYSPDGREGAVLTGAVSAAYPLRQTLIANTRWFPEMKIVSHPGYRADRCFTPDYLRTLARYKVSICTSSIYGYALRKIVESTAAGCVVITDLPTDETLPAIDGSLVRINPQTPPHRIGALVRHLIATYDPERQRHFAGLALARYDYRAEGSRLVGEIETLRRRYP